MAGRAFFVGNTATLPFTGFGEPAAVGARNSLLRRYAGRFGGRLPEAKRAKAVRETCKYQADLCVTLLAQWRSEEPESVALERFASRTDRSGIELMEALEKFYSDDNGADDEPVLLDKAQAASERYVRHYHHVAPFDGESLLAEWAHCRVSPPSAEQCQEALTKMRSAEPLKDDAELADLLERCQSELKIGRECQRGFDEARALLSEGEVPSGRD